jgi:plastocyanin
VSLGACGGDDDGAAATPTTPAGDEVVGANGEPVDCDQSDQVVTVEIGDFEFLPTPVQVDLCDAVVWSNVHSQPHTSTGNGDVSWSTGNIAAAADSDPIVFDTPGEFAYMCALHPFMKGVVEVT